MRAFLLRLLGGQPTRTQPEAALTSTDAPPTAGTEPDSTRDGEPATRTDVSAVADAMHKVARVQARMSLKLEDLEGKLEAGFQELRLHNSSRSPADTGVLPKLDAVFDAVDLLEEAARTARASGNSALSEGIASIGLRLVEFIEQVGLSRVGATGVPPDARLFRVVGAEAGGQTHPAGVITRVVRAAVVKGNKIVREGEVLIASKGET